MRVSLEGGENAVGLNLFFFFFFPLWPETRDFQTIKYLSAEESFWDPGLNVTYYLLWSSERYIVEAAGEEEEFLHLEEKTCFKPSAAATCSPNYIAWQWDKLMDWGCSEQKKRWKIWDKCTKLKANCSKLPSSKVSCVWKTSPHNTTVLLHRSCSLPCWSSISRSKVSRSGLGDQASTEKKNWGKSK